MKKVFYVLFASDNYPQRINIVLLILRITVGLFMLSHGAGKFSKLFGDKPIMFADPIGVGVEGSLALAVFAEVFCSVLLLVGFGTRLATIPLIITMLVAVLYVHVADPFAKQEMALHYLLAYALLLISGSGKYSVDYLIHAKQHRASFA